MSRGYVPLSVRHGGWRAKIGWKVKGGCERVALWLAPWLNPRYYDLWKQAEEDRRQADADLRKAVQTVLDLRATGYGNQLVNNLQARRYLDEIVARLDRAAASQGEQPS